MAARQARWPHRVRSGSAVPNYASRNSVPAPSKRNSEALVVEESSQPCAQPITIRELGKKAVGELRLRSYPGASGGQIKILQSAIRVWDPRAVIIINGGPSCWGWILKGLGVTLLPEKEQRQPKDDKGSHENSCHANLQK